MKNPKGGMVDVLKVKLDHLRKKHQRLQIKYLMAKRKIRELYKDIDELEMIS